MTTYHVQPKTLLSQQKHIISEQNHIISVPFSSPPPPQVFRCRMCFCCFVAAGVFFGPLVAAGVVLFVVGTADAFFFFVAAGGIFSRFVASSTVLDSLPHVCLLIRCRKCCLCLVAACAVFICFGVACTLGASRPHAFFFFTLSHVLSLFGSVPLVLWVPTLISFHSGHRKCRFW